MSRANMSTRNYRYEMLQKSFPVPNFSQINVYRYTKSIIAYIGAIVSYVNSEWKWQFYFFNQRRSPDLNFFPKESLLRQLFTH